MLCMILHSFRHLIKHQSFVLRAVAIQHNEDGKEHKTKFAPNFDFSKWTQDMILNLKLENRAQVLELMLKLAQTFEAAGKSFVETAPAQANLGDCVMFPTDMCHAAAAPQHESLPRVTSYMSFVPKVVVDDRKWSPLLEALFTSEHVCDRRTMVDPFLLTKMMTMHGEDPIVAQKAVDWLTYGKHALVKGNALKHNIDRAATHLIDLYRSRMAQANVLRM